MELFKLLGTIAVDSSGANQALDDVSQKAGSTSDEVSSSVSKIGTVAGNIAKGIGVAGAAIGGAWIAAIEGSREYRAEMALLESAFETAGHSSTEAKNTYSELNAVLGDSGQAVEASQHIALLADNEKELQTWTDICTGVYATFGESLPIEGLAEAANETAKTGILTGGLTDALNWAGIKEEEFQKKLDSCTTEQQRQDLIMNTLNGTYKKASEQYKTTNKDVMDAQKAQEKLTDAFAELWRIGEPILTDIKEKVAEMALTAIPHLENFVNKVKSLMTWINNNKQSIKDWGAVIVGATVSIGAFLLVLKWGSILGAATKAVKTCRAELVLFNATLRANPVGLVISLLAGLVAAFVYLWNNNKGFRNFWISLWEKIKSVCGSAVGWIKGKFNDFNSALGVVKTAFNNIKNSISDKMEEARKKVKSVIDKIKGFFPLSIGKIFSNLKIPKISVSGGKAPFGIAGKGKLPSFNVKWNAAGGILNGATIFGQIGNTLLGGGEAGPEAIAPIDVLFGYVKEAVQTENEGIIRTLIEQNRILMEFLSRVVPSRVILDSGVLVGELVPAIDGRLADRWIHSKRGNTR
jgi:hypothetical protein